MRWLIDEMLPPALAEQLSKLGHDTVWVDGADRRGAADRDLFARAAAEGRCIVTENLADFAALFDERSGRGDTCVPIVFVRRRAFGRGGGLAHRVAEHLHAWAEDNPEPYVGLHWP